MIAALIVLALAAAPDVIHCTDAEYAYHEAQGWDAYECDGDKAAEAEERAK